MIHILVADDEKEIIQLIRLYLEKDDICIHEAYDGAMAYDILQKLPIDLAIIDIMMPKLNGFELIRKVRKTMEVPILVLSAKVELTNRILGLELGADDYMTKPFEPLELAAKVKAMLRRIKSGSTKTSEEDIIVGEFTLKASECVLIRRGEEIPLTKTELLILKLFMENPGRVFTKEMIYEAGWGADYVVDDNTIRVIISRIREKLGDGYITTIRGLGYRLEKQ